MVFRPVIIVLILISNIFSYNAKYEGRLYRDGSNARNESLGGLSFSFLDGRNPALLTNNQGSSISFSHKNKFSGLAKVSFLSFLHAKNKHPYLLSLITRTINDIPDTRSAWNYESNTIDYNKITFFSQNEIGFQISTIRILDPFTIGINLKPNFIGLSNYKGYGISSDLSVMYNNNNEKIKIFLQLIDIIGVKYWSTGTKESIHPVILAGLYYNYSNFNFGIERGFYIDKYSPHPFHIGIEYINNNNLFVRLGASHENMLTLGVGMKVIFMDIDFAYIVPAKGIPLNETFVLSGTMYLKQIMNIKEKIAP